MMENYILNYDEINLKDLPRVGGKNASIGEMIQHLQTTGINVPDGFAITVKAYWDFFYDNHLEGSIKPLLNELDRTSYSNLSMVGRRIRQFILDSEIPYTIQVAILAAYEELLERTADDISVAVRSSATAEDLPEASFAGQQESFLNIKSREHLLEVCRRCYASLFTDRAIKYREDHGFDHLSVGLSIGVQMMVRSDKACAGVGFTIEPDSGFQNVVVINGAWGLGENVVKGNVDPDEFIVFKPALKNGKKSIISKKIGAKQHTMVYSNTHSSNIVSKTTTNLNTNLEEKSKYVLNDEEITTLAQWGILLENHYQKPMDFEWAKDGVDGQLYLVQARPETVFTNQRSKASTIYTLNEKGKVITTGIGLGNKITSGKAKIILYPSQSQLLTTGDILITEKTDPDWDPILKKVKAVVTDKGGRTSHAAIVARELGAVAIVGTTDGTQKIKTGDVVTVSCAEGQTGYVYEGALSWKEEEVDLVNIHMPDTEVLLILGDPGRAFDLAMYPGNGVGLMRQEFIINNTIRIHPMALIHFDKLEDAKAKQQIAELTKSYPVKSDYFIDKLSQAVAIIAAAFYPRKVIVRMSDFKSNEYANLMGGQQFEPIEENPMLGFRGASRYDHDKYRAAFELECAAMKIVREDMGMNNVKLMIPFCRTVEEGKRVIELMSKNGLKQGVDELEIYTMIEIPSNVILADKFAQIFDGFSIGSNDLTQLTLGLDRDNALISELFDENNQAVKAMISEVIKAARKNKIKIGLCGQAPSDYPAFAQFLVEQGIDSISFNADALLSGIENINIAEQKLGAKKIREKKVPQLLKTNQ